MAPTSKSATEPEDNDEGVLRERWPPSGRPTVMKARLIIVPIALAALALSACGGQPIGAADPTSTTIATTTTSVAGYLVSGYVHAGPICPVVQNPPDPACEDRAVAEARLLVTGDDGTTVVEVRTDSDGRFGVYLPVGNYSLIPQPVDGLLGTAESQEFTVGAGVATHLDIAYDTGIR